MSPDATRLPSLRSTTSLPEHLLAALDVDLEDHAVAIQFCKEAPGKIERLTLEREKSLSLEAPIRCVPAEILSKIIHWAIGGPGAFVNKNARQQFLCVRQVSALWRRTAFTTPHLWRYLSVDTRIGFGRSPSPVMMELKRMVPRWFRRAGQGAEVHLELHGLEDLGESDALWGCVLWGAEESPYRLTTVRFKGSIVTLSEIGEHRPTMSDLRNLSIRPRDRPGPLLNLDAIFPSIKSLSLVGATNLLHRNLVCHSSLRSLCLSQLILACRGFSNALQELPSLEELIMVNSTISEAKSFPVIVNTSIQKLVCPAATLLRWPPITLSGLRSYKMIHNSIRHFFYYVQETQFFESISERGTEHYLPFVGGILSNFNSHSLTVDLMSMDLNPERLFSFIRGCGQLQTLLLEDASPLLLDETHAREWRSEPNIKNVISRRYVDHLPLFAETPTTRDASPSSPPSFSITAPHQTEYEREPAHFRCSDSSLNCTIDFTRLPQWHVDSLIQEAFDIRNHDFEDVMKEIESHPK
jgi:hypothetical protein